MGGWDTEGRCDSLQTLVCGTDLDVLFLSSLICSDIQHHHSSLGFFIPALISSLSLLLQICRELKTVPNHLCPYSDAVYVFLHRNTPGFGRKGHMSQNQTQMYCTSINTSCYSNDL